MARRWQIRLAQITTQSDRIQMKKKTIRSAILRWNGKWVSKPRSKWTCSDSGPVLIDNLSLVFFPSFIWIDLCLIVLPRLPARWGGKMNLCRSEVWRKQSDIQSFVNSFCQHISEHVCICCWFWWFFRRFQINIRNITYLARILNAIAMATFSQQNDCIFHFHGRHLISWNYLENNSQRRFNSVWK